MWEALPIIAPRNAPARNWPSIAMLTTPDRSHITPDSAPYTSGVAETSVPASSWTKSSVPPRAAQTRNDQVNTTTPTPKIA